MTRPRRPAACPPRTPGRGSATASTTTRRTRPATATATTPPTTSVPTEPTTESILNLGPIRYHLKPHSSFQPELVSELDHPLKPAESRAEDLIEQTLGVLLHMKDWKDPTQKKEKIVMTKLVVVGRGANLRNVRSILPVIIQAPDLVHIPTHH